MAAAGSGAASAAARAAGLGLASVLKGGTAAAAKATLEGVYAHTPPGIIKFNDVVIASGEGCWVTTTDGRRLLDMSSGIGAVSTGHCHPAVVEAVRRQAGRIVHAQQNVFGAHDAMVDLYDRLSAVLPPALDSYLLANSGAEAVENAIKMARAATGRQNIIAFEGGFHGRTMGAMALTSSKTIYRRGFGPLMPGVHIAPYPYCLHCKAQEAVCHSGYPAIGSPGAVSCCGGPLDSLRWMLATQSAPSDTAAVILEPILGEGGFVEPPPGFLAAVRRLTAEHGILLIADEVQAGAGRTGKWWGHQHWLPGDAASPSPSPSPSSPASPSSDGLPDLLVFAKGIASGYPLAGVAARSGLLGADKMPPGTLGGTYGGNAVCCAAASATIDVIAGEGLLANAEARGRQIMQGIAALAAELPPGLIADVRGRGLMVGVEFGGAGGGGGGAGGEPGAPRMTPAARGVASAITRACAARGMLLLTSGARECVRFLPPLTLSAAEADQALDVFGQAVREVMLGQKK
ncbi:hypothetical protein HYH03_010280 [Edaphochlamys debaryana]|uniref:4-aminobutyrate aminotransferase n=1 Tax=Edaphochlamys debaryana TaxID=47281 RepID=A0A835XYB5_9CHLO|nr:hypothetical protein HYH03_010280 [Edaphochlamys debaryana]|eukprot:KAG2491273.1 hypothetical protein HYH03_010280 [Edaphochlamys debaryana]